MTPSLTVLGSSVTSTLLQLLSISSFGFQPSSAAGVDVPTRWRAVTLARTYCPTLKNASSEGTSSSSSSDSSPASDPESAFSRAVSACEIWVIGTCANIWFGSETTRWRGWIEWIRPKMGVPTERRCGPARLKEDRQVSSGVEGGRGELDPKLRARPTHLVVQVLDA